MKLIRKRLTYANVMSSIAVFLILGGATAVAAKKIGSNGLKPNSVTTAKIKKNAVTTSKLKNSSVNTSKLANNAVASAKIADNAVTNAKIANGAVTSAKAAADFTAPFANQPARFANISSGGVVLAGTRGIAQANVTKGGTGFYCLSGLTPAPVGGVATIDYSEAGTNVTIQFDIGQGPVCPAGTQAFVNPRSGGLAEDAGFFLTVY